MTDLIASLPFPLLLALLFAVAFIQNMAFTAVSRSRNAGDVGYHRKTAWASNGIWFLTQLLIMGTIWPILTNPEASLVGFAKIAVVALVYIIATTEGSCLMMARLLRTEQGKQRVGAR